MRIAPSTATICRVLNAACPGGLADLLGQAALFGQAAGARDAGGGRQERRGSRHSEIPAAHLLAAIAVPA